MYRLLSSAAAELKLPEEGSICGSTASGGSKKKKKRLDTLHDVQNTKWPEITYLNFHGLSFNATAEDEERDR